MEKINKQEEVASASDDELVPPTEEERHILRRVPGSIPAVSYVLCVAELAERASYYGATTVFNVSLYPVQHSN